MTKPFTRNMRPDFLRLVECCYQICRGDMSDEWTVRWTCLRDKREYPDIPLPVDRHDIMMEAILVYMRLREKFIRSKKKVFPTLKDYVRAFASTSMREVIRRLEKEYISSGAEVFWQTEEPTERHDRQPNENIEFLLGRGPISSLVERFTTYERHLIYLYYLEGKSLLAMEPLLQKERHVIAQHMTKVDRKIRRIANEFHRHG